MSVHGLLAYGVAARSCGSQSGVSENKRKKTCLRVRCQSGVSRYHTILLTTGIIHRTHDACNIGAGVPAYCVGLDISETRSAILCPEPKAVVGNTQLHKAARPRSYGWRLLYIFAAFSCSRASYPGCLVLCHGVLTSVSQPPKSWVCRLFLTMVELCKTTAYLQLSCRCAGIYQTVRHQVHLVSRQASQAWYPI